MRKVYRCEHTVPPVWWFTFADRNALGEEIVVEFRKNENTHGKHSLPRASSCLTAIPLR